MKAKEMIQKKGLNLVLKL